MIDMMKCQYCNLEFEEKDIELSHDVPCYLFPGKNRREKKNQADKFGRHNLCKGCHTYYENILPSIIIKALNKEQIEIVRNKVKSFSQSYFGGKDESN